MGALTFLLSKIFWWFAAPATRVLLAALAFLAPLLLYRRRIASLSICAKESSLSSSDTT
jgi:hypothetical protein